ncbi:molybdate ABC transporter substrate-binding protein [Salinicoccus albus]|uniref:molybdate ABC transporter substrate-binding protein n=1 Tax=Salinicoccus albus TaxID=418756 RepID=UPI001FDFBB72|nr:molybdate ABC transporter substrate-binding protein [Salinicoccus albus]
MRYIQVLVICGIILLMTACADDETSDSDRIEGTITVSAAASLTDAMNDAAEVFNDEYPEVQVDYNFGGSGKLQQQIIQGAPADLFISANTEHFQTVAEAGYIDEDDAVDLLENELVLIVPEDNDNVSSFDDLNEAENIAIGNPETVPAGRYGVQVLESMGIREASEGRLVYSEDVRAVLTYVETGNADAGIVYATDAQVSEGVEVAEAAPEGSHDPIVYPSGVMADSENPAAAEAFHDFLQSEAAKEVFESYGFTVQ